MQRQFRDDFLHAFASIWSLALLAAFGGCSIPGEDESQVLGDVDDPGHVSVMDASIPESPKDDGVHPNAFDDAGANVRDAGISRANPSSPLFVSIKPLGNGCPAGSASVSLSPDGGKMLVRFTAFEAAVDETKSVDVKVCQLAIKLKSPQGLSFGVSDFFCQGYAYLEKGQRARQTAKYYFQGQPAANQREARVELMGPFDDTYTFQDTLGLADIVWSPCAAERDLQINMALRLQNGTTKGIGYINLDTMTGFRLSWRSCK